MTQEDLLNPRWTAVISVPSNSTIQQTEAFLVQLIEVSGTIIIVVS